MEKMIASGEFLETTEFSSNLYGTRSVNRRTPLKGRLLVSLSSKKAVEDVARTGRICVLDVDKQGVKNIRKTDLHPLFIYISPPSYEILERRLRARKTDSESAIDKRLKESKESMEFSQQPGVYDHIVLNDQLDEAYKNFKALLRQVKSTAPRKDGSFSGFYYRTSRKSCKSRRNNEPMLSSDSFFICRIRTFVLI